MSTGITLSRTFAISGLLLCVLLAPIVAHAAALPAGDEADWIASLSGLHSWASGIAPGSVYRSFGLVTPMVYLLLLLSLWLSHAPGTEVLRWTLGVAAFADAFAYGLPSGINSVPGTIEFFALPVLLVGVGIAAWNQRGNGPWPWLVGLCIPLAFAGMALVQYWPHGALLAVALACCLLTWAPRLIATAATGPPLPRTPPARPGPSATTRPGQGVSPSDPDAVRDEGLLQFRRGRSISVAGTPERGAVVARAKELVDFARLQGYRVDELVTIIEKLG